jgi:hypothetical protein
MGQINPPNGYARDLIATAHPTSHGSHGFKSQPSARKSTTHHFLSHLTTARGGAALHRGGRSPAPV